MKVIGKVNEDTYICIVNKDEIEKFLNKYYNKMQRLNVGENIDLGKGYDFAFTAKQCMEKTQEFIDSNKKIIEAIFSGIEILSKHNEE